MISNESKNAKTDNMHNQNVGSFSHSQLYRKRLFDIHIYKRTGVLKFGISMVVTATVASTSLLLSHKYKHYFAHVIFKKINIINVEIDCRVL